MKELLKILIGLVGTVVVAIAGLFYLATGMMAGVADDFFAAVKKQDIAAAHDYLTEDFKASTDEATLKQFLATQALLDFKQTTWSKRHIASGRGQLGGEVITANGAVVPMKLMFVKENGAWKIRAIQKPTVELQDAQSGEMSASLPAKAEQVALIKRAMVDFGISTTSNDMKHFHSTLARSWQRHTTPQKLSETFAGALRKRLDFTLLEQFEPVIEPVTGLNENGELLLEGYFAAPPARVDFEQIYTYEGLGWKLIGFGFSSRRIEDKAESASPARSEQTLASAI